MTEQLFAGPTASEPTGSASAAETGSRFEKLIRRALETAPGYGPDRFSQVWLWSDWPDRGPLGYGADIGIDIVAEQTATARNRLNVRGDP